MSNIRDAWFKMMQEKYNTDEQGVREIMRQRQKKAKLKGTRGGFNSEHAKRISQAGVDARHVKANQAAQKNDTTKD